MQKLMIADGSEIYVSVLESALTGQFDICTCCDGESALAILQSFRPDILVLNLSLPYKDGLTLLQESDFRPPIIITITGYISHYVEHRLGELGVDYTMISPSVSSLCLRLRDITERYNTQPDSMEPQAVTAHHLHLLNIPSHRDGYRHLLVAIPLFAKNPMQFMTKELYPQVARICGCRDGRAVEHSIRKVIESAWKYRDNAVWRKYFPPGPRGSIPCPSNKAFISQLAEMVNSGIL